MSDIPATVIESLERISKALENLPSDTKQSTMYLGAIAAGIGKIDLTTLKASSKEVDTAAKRLNAANTESSKKYESIFADEIAAKEKTTEALISFADTVKNTKTQMVSFGKSLSKFDGSFSSLTDSLSNLPVIGGLAGGLGFLAGVVDESINAFRAVSQSGIQFENGILGINQASGELGIGLQQTAEMFKKYSSVIQRVGAPAFTNFINEVRTSSDELYSMGFTYQDIIDSSSQFLETQRNLTGLRTLNEQEQKLLFNDTVKEFHKAAQITGVGVKELLDRMNESSNDPATALILARIPKEGRELYEQIRAIDPGMAEMLLEGLKRGSLNMVDSFNNLIGTTGQDLARSLMEMIQTGTGDVSDMRDLYRRLGPELAREFNNLMLAGREDAAAALAASSMAENKLSDVDPSDPSPISDTDKALLNAGPAMQNAIAGIRQVLIEGVVELLEPGSAFGAAISSGISSFISFLKDPDNIEAIKNLMAGIKTAVTGIGTILSGISGFVDLLQKLTGTEGELTNALITGVVALTAWWGAKMMAFAAASKLGELMTGGRLGRGMASSPRQSRPRGRAALALAVITALTGAAASAYNYFSDDEEDTDKSETETETKSTVPDDSVSTTDVDESAVNDAILESAQNEINQEMQSQTVDIDEGANRSDKGVSGNLDVDTSNTNTEKPEPTSVTEPMSLEYIKKRLDEINASLATPVDSTIKTPQLGNTVTPSVATPSVSTTEPQRSTQPSFTPLAPDSVRNEQNPIEQQNNSAILNFEKRTLEESEETLTLVRLLAATTMQMADSTNSVNKNINSSIV